MKPIFLDRDGVINRFPGMGGYVTTHKQFKFLPKAKKAIAHLTKAGFDIFVISNQSCVAQGLMSAQDLELINQKMLSQIQKAGGKIKKVYYCIHQRSAKCACRKPNVGSFKRALKGSKVNPKKIFFIGDSEVDIKAGKKIGCKMVLVLSGRIKKKTITHLKLKPDFVKKNLWEATRWILNQKS